MFWTYVFAALLFLFQSISDLSAWGQGFLASRRKAQKVLLRHWDSVASHWCLRHCDSVAAVIFCVQDWWNCDNQIIVISRIEAFYIYLTNDLFSKVNLLPMQNKMIQHVFFGLERPQEFWHWDSVKTWVGIGAEILEYNIIIWYYLNTCAHYKQGF